MGSTGPEGREKDSDVRGGCAEESGGAFRSKPSGQPEFRFAGHARLLLGPQPIGGALCEDLQLPQYCSPGQGFERETAAMRGTDRVAEGPSQRQAPHAPRTLDYLPHPHRGDIFHVPPCRNVLEQVAG